MGVQIKPLTQRELIGYFTVYREAFPDWNVEHEVVLTRTEWPVKQVIDFQKLRSGAYRPSCSVQVLPTPGPLKVLSQWLDLKHRTIERRQHAEKYQRVIGAMEEQFKPSLRNPLNPLDVLELAEREIEDAHVENSNPFCALACLNAALGEMHRAVYWCNRVESLIKKSGSKATDWQRTHQEYARSLADSVAHSRSAEFLSKF